MDDYSKLMPVEDAYLDMIYFPEGTRERLKEFTGVMVDQPEIFIAKDSALCGRQAGCHEDPRRYPASGHD